MKGKQPGSFEKLASVDSVTHSRDPKGGLFGPWLTKVFYNELDEPIVFCGWDRRFASGTTLTTVYYDYESGTAEHSACKQSYGVFQGDVLWNNGDPKSRDQLFQEAKAKLESQKAFVTGLVIANIPQSRYSGNTLVLRIEDSGPDMAHHIDGILSKPFILCELSPLEKGQHVRIDYVMRFATPEVICMGITNVTSLGDDLPLEILDTTKRKGITDIDFLDAKTVPLDLYKGHIPIKIQFAPVSTDDCGSGGCNLTIMATAQGTSSRGEVRTVSKPILSEFGEIFLSSEFTGNYRNLVTLGGGSIILWKLYEDPTATQMSGATYQPTACFTRNDDQALHRNLCMPAPGGITTVR
jgi:hypothetical protein